jgi:hypothetical protein
MRTEI